ncbi:MAG: hypothetical protein ACRD1T_05710 [Acidimicrobiia bacterium]
MGGQPDRHPDSHRNLKARVCLWLLFVLGPGTSAPASGDWFITPFVGATFKGKTSFVDPESAAGLVKWNYGGNLTVVGSGGLGVEVDFGRTPGFFEHEDNPDCPECVTGSSVTTLAGNVVLAVPLSVTRQSLRPYASGGLGMIRVHLREIADIVPVNTTLLGINVGGGAMGMLTENIGLRWDLRYFRSVTKGKVDYLLITDERRLSTWRATMGVVIRR